MNPQPPPDADIPLDVCQICGKPIPLSQMSSNRDCVAHPGVCKREYTRRQQNERHATDLDPVNVALIRYETELVEDPTGDFTPGAKFSRWDVAPNGRLRDGSQVWDCWAEGTVFAINGRRWVVAEAEDGYRLEAQP